MAERPLKRADARDWKGMISAADPHDLPPDALQVLENMQILNRGELLGRAGYRRLGFLTGDTSNPSPSPVVSMYNFQHATGEVLAYQTESGAIKAAVLGVAMLVLCVLPTTVKANDFGRKQQGFCWPAKAESIANDVRLESTPLAPFDDRQCLAADGDSAVVSLVPVLLHPGCPAAVAWSVRTVIISSIDGVFRRRTRPHVFQKGLERVKPSVTDRDPAAAVTVEVAGFGVSATLLDSAPGLELCGLAQSVRGLGRRASLTSQASAAPLPSAPEASAVDMALLAAVTKAFPSRSTVRPRNPTSYDETAKPHSPQVNQYRHLLAPDENRQVTKKLRKEREIGR